ncbi:OLC1v1008862C1 [Oldenlandia corymbosa var. corymbosa]|uniref:OLC1v1008862C1 n=1 Tax=Oldenlandia corymbosa var. corymbosa TaxID=529605 RepID=A0AAV1DMP0_OLDCO|nr:OLC1v1008862C1 [Oldenlandia corymbosa var. corymbosa]
MDGICKEISVDAGKAFLGGMRDTGLFDVITFNTLLNSYCAGGQVDNALNLLASMRKEGISFNRVTFNIMVNFFCKVGSFQQAKKLVNVMRAQGINPDGVTYTTFITCAMKERRRAEEVIELHDFLVLQGVIPDTQIYKEIIRPLLLLQNEHMLT